MSLLEEVTYEIDAIKDSIDTHISDLVELVALKERTRIFNHLQDLIQEKDSNNDHVAVEVLAWAWETLAQV